MSHILSIATAVPEHCYSQVQLKDNATRIYDGQRGLERLLAVFETAGVQQRHLAFPLSYYTSGKSFDERNADYTTKSLELLEQATGEALEKANVNCEQIDHIFCVTTTGLATPSLEALLVHRMGFRSDVRRSPLFGIGCAGGVAALARAAEYLKAFPNQHVLVLAVELCGQVFSPRALTPTDLIGAALFSDGAAAVVMGGEEAARGGPRILFSRTNLFPDTQDLMGWDFTANGMRLRLSRKVPQIVLQYVKPAVERFVAECAMSSSDIRHWVLHPGGPRVMEAYREAFGISHETLAPARDCLRDFGNLSSAATLFVLESVAERASVGDRGLMVALGPGFAAEMILLRW
ncbi:MAG: type III polyketide synthase [Gemmatimonadales bacterium]